MADEHTPNPGSDDDATVNGNAPQSPYGQPGAENPYGEYPGENDAHRTDADSVPHQESAYGEFTKHHEGDDDAATNRFGEDGNRGAYVEPQAANPYGQTESNGRSADAQHGHGVNASDAQSAPSGQPSFSEHPYGQMDQHDSSTNSQNGENTSGYSGYNGYGASASGQGGYGQAGYGQSGYGQNGYGQAGQNVTGSDASQAGRTSQPSHSSQSSHSGSGASTSYGQSGSTTGQSGNSYGQPGAGYGQSGSSYGQNASYGQQGASNSTPGAYGQSASNSYGQSGNTYGQNSSYGQGSGNSAYGQNGGNGALSQNGAGQYGSGAYGQPQSGNQPGYQGGAPYGQQPQPYGGQQAPAKSGSSMATIMGWVSIAAAAIALLALCFPSPGWLIAIAPAVIGVVAGAMAMGKANPKRVFGMIGLIGSGLAVLIIIATAIVVNLR